MNLPSASLQPALTADAEYGASREHVEVQFQHRVFKFYKKAPADPPGARGRRSRAPRRSSNIYHLAVPRHMHGMPTVISPDTGRRESADERPRMHDEIDGGDLGSPAPGPDAGGNGEPQPQECAEPGIAPGVPPGRVAQQSRAEARKRVEFTASGLGGGSGGGYSVAAFSQEGTRRVGMKVTIAERMQCKDVAW